jgi:hypothetical protein
LINNWMVRHTPRNRNLTLHCLKVYKHLTLR